jgi:hypothetical protein
LNEGPPIEVIVPAPAEVDVADSAIAALFELLPVSNWLMEPVCELTNPLKPVAPFFFPK